MHSSPLLYHRQLIISEPTNVRFTFQSVLSRFLSASHIAVAACHIVHSAADMLTMSKRQFRPVLVEHMEFAINVILYQQQSLFRHLLAVAVDQLDAVVVIRIMAGRNHDATVKVIHTGDVGHGRSGGDMKQIPPSRERRFCPKTASLIFPSITSLQPLFHAFIFALCTIPVVLILHDNKPVYRSP